MLPELQFKEVDLGLDGINYGEFNVLLNATVGKIPFKCSIFSVDPGKSTPEDRHEVEECWLILAGEGELTYEGIKHQIAPGSLFHFSSHMPHKAENSGLTELRIFSMWWPTTQQDAKA